MVLAIQMHSAVWCMQMYWCLQCMRIYILTAAAATAIMGTDADRTKLSCHSPRDQATFRSQTNATGSDQKCLSILYI